MGCRVDTLDSFLNTMTVPATAALDIANLALAELGQEPLADLTTTTNKAVRQVNANYAMVRNEVLRAHPWNCATKRTTLAASSKTITGATAASPVVITSAGHGLTTGQYVAIAGVVGMTQLNGNRYKVTVINSSTFSLASTSGTATDGLLFGSYSSGGTATVCPAWGFQYAYALPSDWVRVAQTEDKDQGFKVIGNLILSDVSELNIEYIYQLEDVSLMDQLLVSSIASLLAARIALPITGSQDLKLKMEGLHQQRISEARFADSREQQGEDLSAYSWVNDRIGGSSEFADTQAR